MRSLPGNAAETMLTIRLLEDRLQAMALQGRGADWHFSKGQEATSVGVCAVLRDTDYVVTHHRAIAHAIAKGIPLRPLLAELLGKAEGMNGGMAGEMHMSYLPKRFMFSWQLVGTCVPVAAGMAWAVKNHLRTDDVVVVFHGDAATANGQWHEGMNLAAVQQVPLLLVCENNHMAGNVREEFYNPVAPYLRAAAYGIESALVDGNDVELVMAAAERIVEWVRKEQRPYLLECDTTRLGRHKQGMGDLRSKEEMALLAERDPLQNVHVEASVERALVEEIDHVLAWAEALPPPIVQDHRRE